MKIRTIMCYCLAAALFASCGNGNTPEPAVSAPVKIEPGEQAPLAAPGQRNFGGMATGAPRDTTGMAERMRRMREEMNKVRTVHFNDLSMSDPYIYPHKSQITIHKSQTMENWRNIIIYWNIWLSPPIVPVL